MFWSKIGNGFLAKTATSRAGSRLSVAIRVLYCIGSKMGEKFPKCIAETFY